MSFHWLENSSVQIDNLVTAIKNELINNGGWSAPDGGYDVVRNPSSEFDVFLSLEATNKRYLQFEVGNWNATTHVMDDIISFGHVLFDKAGAISAGTLAGMLRMSYDDDHVFIWTDYRAHTGDSGRRCLGYSGKASAYSVGDLVVVGGSTLFRGTNPTPTNTSTSAGVMNELYDISGVATNPDYYTGAICPSVGFSNLQPVQQMYAPKIDKRLLTPIFLMSNSTSPTGGENAGIRARFIDGYTGGARDAETHGQTLTAADLKVFMYFVQADTFIYSHFMTRMWVRQT